ARPHPPPKWTKSRVPFDAYSYAKRKNLLAGRTNNDQSYESGDHTATATTDAGTPVVEPGGHLRQPPFEIGPCIRCGKTVSHGTRVRPGRGSLVRRRPTGIPRAPERDRAGERES